MSDEMKSRKLVMMVGLPRSGKTTKALELSEEYGSPVVNPDSVRLALHGQAFVASAEGVVWAHVYLMVNSLFLAGHEEVIIDACNNTRKRRKAFIYQCLPNKVEYVAIQTPVDVCKDRLTDQNAGLGSVIDRMSEQHEPVGEEELKQYHLGSTIQFFEGV